MREKEKFIRPVENFNTFSDFANMVKHGGFSI